MSKRNKRIAETAFDQQLRRRVESAFTYGLGFAMLDERDRAWSNGEIQEHGIGTEYLQTMAARFRIVLTAERLRRGYSQTALAALVGCERGHIQHLEDGTSAPSFATLCGVAHALMLPIGRFFEQPTRSTR